MHQLLSQRIDECQKDLLLKASIKDLCQLLDEKVSLQDVNKALSKVEEEVEKCAKKEEVAELAQDQQLVTEALCAENCTARWLWKGANLLAG